MFTLKFCNTYDNGESSTTVVCCKHYCVYRFEDRYEVMLYQDYTSVEGVCYTVSPKPIDKPYFQVCYVENINGKTIDKVG